MSIWTNLIDAIVRRVYSSPAEETQPDSFQLHRNNYTTLWAYYSNELFDRARNPQWVGYAAQYGLYRQIRALYNPTRRGVNFYAAGVWPGVLSADGQELPDGLQLAIPFSKDTDPDLKAAIAELWRWWNFQALKSTIPRRGAALGSTLLELRDDVAKGKIYLQQEWPGNVAELDLDNSGNIQRYAVEYYTSDWEFFGGTKPQFTPTYLYRKEIDKESFRYFKNGQPFDYYGNGSVEPNPYGFVPARWVKHIDEGGPHGIAFIEGMQPKVDELNSQASQVSDWIGKAVEMPKAIFSKGKITALGAPSGTEQSSARDLPRQYRNRETVNILVGPEGSTVADLTNGFDPEKALKVMQSLIEEIENDKPELNFWKQLRSMSTLTGPAASRIMGDTESLLQEVSASYDKAITSIFGMGVAMAGERLKLRMGGWANPTVQQLKFAKFDLQSYGRGNLDMEITPRSLLKPFKSEQAQERLTYWQSIKAEIDAGIPIEIALQEDWTPAQLQELKAYRENQVESQLAELEQVKAEKVQLQTQLASGGGGNAVATAAGANVGMKDTQPMMQGASEVQGVK
jgi:hypothetical protein